MIRRTIAIAAFAAILTLATASSASAWGVAHAGYTHVGPTGAYHVGATETRNPYTGAVHYQDHVSGTTAGGYHVNTTTGATYRPSGVNTGYSAGYRVAPGGYSEGYRAGVYRVP